MLATAACAAVADARLPVEAHPTALRLVSFALDIATPAGLSLNENVGLTESFFTYNVVNFRSLPRLFAFCNGVNPELILTILFLFLIGNNSKYLQYVFSVLDSKVSLFIESG